MNKYITFDIGGTDIKYGIINEEFEISEQSSMPTNAIDGGESIIKRIIQITNDYKKNHHLNGVAISSAGIIDPYNGTVIYATDAIPNYIGTPIKVLIEEGTGLTCEVLNDVKCFALCEQHLGNANGAKDFITLTVGTGIGGAIYLNDQMVYGKNFSAGEWGRMIVNNQAFEAIASITALNKYAQTFIGNDDWNGKKIFDLYDNGHPGAIQAVDTFYSSLAIGITNFIYIFNPEVIIIGGGISARGDRFLNELTRFIEAIIEPRFLQLTTIQLAKFKNSSGMIGSLIHYKRMKQIHLTTH